MALAAGALAVCLLLVGGVLPSRLRAAAWPSRAPALALVLWQAAGLAGGLLTLALCATVALAPFGDTPLEALGHLGGPVPWWSWAAVAVGAAVLLRLLSVLIASTARTLSARRRNRLLVDLVGQPSVLLLGAFVVDHDVPVAYCLPGLRPRLVLSRGTLSVLSYEELRAVLAHEHAHLTQRHDLVVLPFVALSATFPLLPPVMTACAEVALLVEQLADDLAARQHDRTHLARALWKIGTGQAPTGALGVARGEDVLLRAQRLLATPAPLPRRTRAAVLVLAAVVALSPLLGLATPSVV